jgi:hypothetical protein
MPSISPGRYQYVIAQAIPGGQWNPEENPGQSDHLVDLIKTTIPDAAEPSPANPLLDLGLVGDDIHLFVQFDHDLSAQDEATLDDLVARSAEYFVVKNGTDVLENGADFEQAANNVDSATLTIQYKKGDGTDDAGHAEVVHIKPQGICPVNAAQVTLDGNGQASFVVGASSLRGEVAIALRSGTMPERTFKAVWV